MPHSVYQKPQHIFVLILMNLTLSGKVSLYRILHLLIMSGLALNPHTNVYRDRETLFTTTGISKMN